MAATARQLGYVECSAALTDHEIVDSMARAFELSHLAGVERCQMDTTSGDNLVFGHAGLLPGLGLCVKAGIQVPSNRSRGIDLVQAVVVLYDASTGEPRAVLDGRAVTLMRTAGALVAGIRAVGTPPRPRVSVLGFGAQGKTVARLAASVLEASEIRVYSRSLPEVPADYVATTSIADSVHNADVIACCTTAVDPVLTADMVAPGTVVASMGSYAPQLCEIDPQIVRQSSLVAADVPAGNLGPVAHLLDLGEPIPRFIALGRDAVQPTDGTRCVFVGGTGVEDACVAWSILLGWPVVDELTRHSTMPRSSPNPWRAPDSNQQPT